jgi:hypothetical protein
MAAKSSVSCCIWVARLKSDDASCRERRPGSRLYTVSATSAMSDKDLPVCVAIVGFSFSGRPRIHSVRSRSFGTAKPASVRRRRRYCDDFLSSITTFARILRVFSSCEEDKRLISLRFSDVYEWSSSGLIMKSRTSLAYRGGRAETKKR